MASAEGIADPSIAAALLYISLQFVICILPLTALQKMTTL
jgi:hypothetical protein